MECINIVMVTDDTYAQHLCVTLTSLFENKESTNPICITILCKSIRKDNKEKITEVLEKYNCDFRFKEISDERYRNLSIKNHMSHAAYYKISIPEMFYNFEKVLFLDCDLVIKDDITNLWSFELGDNHLAAVENPGFNRYDQLKIPEHYKTFNSGVMLMNLTRWRNDKISEKVLSFLNEKSSEVSLHDQDGFNAVLYDKWIPLDPKWNQQSRLFFTNARDTGFSDSEVKIALKDPSIIHFTTSSKPWHYANNHPQKNEYFKYLKLTPYEDFNYTDKNFKNLFKKLVRKFVPQKIIGVLRK